MIKTLKLVTSDDFKVYVSSDFHLNHQGPRSNPLWVSRGFKSPTDMTNGIIETCNKIVRHQDYLVFLGDWCLNTSDEQFEADLSRFNCKNILMLWGNHNNPVERIYRQEVEKWIAWNECGTQPGWEITKSTDVYPFRYKNAVFCGNKMNMMVDGQLYCLNHFPEDVFDQMRHGAFMLCGHSHYGYEKTRKDCKENRRLDVGWDGWRKPLSTDEIKEIMATKCLVGLDHHG
jgi:calcineurin-like phosphoesterase family protein